MFGDAFWSVYHRSNRMRFRSKTMPNMGQPTWSFSSFASFTSLTMNMHWRCSSAHISYTVMYISTSFLQQFFHAPPLPPFCASRQAMWWCEPIRLLPSAQRQRPARGACEPHCHSTPSRPRRSGSPRRHPAACTHLSKSSFSVKSKASNASTNPTSWHDPSCVIVQLVCCVESTPQGPKCEFSKFSCDWLHINFNLLGNTSQESQELDKWCTGFLNLNSFSNLNGKYWSTCLLVSSLYISRWSGWSLLTWLWYKVVRSFLNSG